LSAKEVESLWKDLAGAAPKAYEAVWTLAAAPDQALPLLRGRLHPVPSVDGPHLTKLVADLDSDRFAVREDAARTLEKLGELAAPALTGALKAKPSPELRRRCELLLAKLESPPPPDILRGIRALEVLEQIGTSEALDVLKKLAKGAPEARLTREAKASLERLAQRLAAAH
jgi:hypothetical protein